MRIASNHIVTLQPNEIFVFGSNLEGQHAGGAAYLAYKRFGAIWGQGVGLQGQSYAEKHPSKTFLVTEIGCGIAGFTVGEIAPLFEQAKEVENIYLPQRFWEVLRE